MNQYIVEEQGEEGGDSLPTKCWDVGPEPSHPGESAASFSDIVSPYFSDSNFYQSPTDGHPASGTPSFCQSYSKIPGRNSSYSSSDCTSSSDDLRKRPRHSQYTLDRHGSLVSNPKHCNINCSTSTSGRGVEHGVCQSAEYPKRTLASKPGSGSSSQSDRSSDEYDPSSALLLDDYLDPAFFDKITPDPFAAESNPAFESPFEANLFSTSYDQSSSMQSSERRTAALAFSFKTQDNGDVSTNTGFSNPKPSRSSLGKRRRHTQPDLQSRPSSSLCCPKCNKSFNRRCELK